MKQVKMRLVVDFPWMRSVLWVFFSALTLFVKWHERYLAFNNQQQLFPKVLLQNECRKKLGANQVTQVTTTTKTTTTTTLHYTTLQPFTALCPGLPRWAGTRRSIHPLTPILIISHPLSASFIYYNPLHPPYSIHVSDSLHAQPLSKSSLV